MCPRRRGFELTRTVATREALIEVLRERAGLAITRELRDTPTLVVRRRQAQQDPPAG